jgi:hypothetical protein
MAGPAAKIEMWDVVEAKKNNVRVEDDVVRVEASFLAAIASCGAL